MKRRSAKKITRKPAPYTKYGKAPYLYSEQYQQWKAACLRGDKVGMSRNGEAHARRYMP